MEKQKRVFTFQGMSLDDPDPAFTETEVIAFYANTYPELNIGYIAGRETNEEGELELEIKIAAGSKA